LPNRFFCALRWPHVSHHTGWKEIPAAGDELLEAPNGEREAAKVVANRIALADRQKLLADTEVINVKRQEDRAKMEAEHEAEKAVKQSGGNVTEARLAASKRAAAEARENTFKELRIVIKGDVSGTVEAVEGALSGIGNKEAGVRVVHTGVGEVTDSDVAMAEASGGEPISHSVANPSDGDRLQRAMRQKHQDVRDAEARRLASRVGHLSIDRDCSEKDGRALAAHDRIADNRRRDSR